MIHDSDLIKQLLLSKWHYKEKQVDGVINKILLLTPEIQDAFDQYIDSNEYPQHPKIFGLTPAEIAKNYPFKPPAVFLCLDWIKREPQNALDALVEEYKKPLPESFDSEQYRQFINNKKQ